GMASEDRRAARTRIHRSPARPAKKTPAAGGSRPSSREAVKSIAVAAERFPERPPRSGEEAPRRPMTVTLFRAAFELAAVVVALAAGGFQIEQQVLHVQPQ